MQNASNQRSVPFPQVELRVVEAAFFGRNAYNEKTVMFGEQKKSVCEPSIECIGTPF